VIGGVNLGSMPPSVMRADGTCDSVCLMHTLDCTVRNNDHGVTVNALHVPGWTLAPSSKVPRLGVRMDGMSIEVVGFWLGKGTEISYIDRAASIVTTNPDGSPIIPAGSTLSGGTADWFNFEIIFILLNKNLH
jgi:hypothetical protein